MRTFVALVCTLAVFAVLSSSCKKDNNNNVTPCATSWAVDLQDEAAALGDAASAYAQDPSTANCNAYQQAYQNWINGLQGWANCASAAGLQQEWQEAVNDAQDALANLC